MKKLFVIFSIVLFISACSKQKTKEGLAKLNIKSYIDSTLNDPKSYESISFGNLDTLYNTVYTDSAYLRLEIISTDIEIENSNLLIKDYDKWNAHKPIYQKTIDSIKKLEDIAMSNYKPRFIGYQMTHKLRAKNALGALMLQEWRFKFDKKCDIIGVSRINE